MSRIHFTRIAPAVALAILAGCSSPSDGAPANSQQVQAPQEVTVARPETRRITQRITLTATIEAYEQVALYAKVAGYVKTLDVDIGDRVRAGQLLATLEVPEIQSQLRRAQSDAELAQIVFTRSQRLRAREAFTKEDLDNARANFQATQARLNEIKTMLNYSRITSPIHGVVTRRFVDPGALMQAATSTNNATPIVTVARVDTSSGLCGRARSRCSPDCQGRTRCASGRVSAASDLRWNCHPIRRCVRPRNAHDADRSGPAQSVRAVTAEDVWRPHHHACRSSSRSDTA